MEITKRTAAATFGIIALCCLFLGFTGGWDSALAFGIGGTFGALVSLLIVAVWEVFDE